VFAVSRGFSDQALMNVNYIELDLARESWGSVLPSDVDVVIHLAQSDRFRDFPSGALDVFDVNIKATARLLDFAHQVGAKHFIYASSGGIYGNGAEAFNENAAMVSPGQLGYYLGSKACGEILVQSYASLFQVTIIRPFFMYGPRQKRSMLIPRLMDCVASEKPISLQGNDGIRINPVHVTDASAAVVAALDANKSATYNIAGPDVLSIRQISEAMGNYLGKAPIFQQAEGRAQDLIADISAMCSDLSRPVISLTNSEILRALVV
jgi:UDP-glucose 4-epimerase